MRLSRFLHTAGILRSLWPPEKKNCNCRIALDTVMNLASVRYLSYSYMCCSRDDKLILNLVMNI